MNRLLLRRLAVNVFWSLVYVCAAGYVAYVNFVTGRAVLFAKKDQAEESPPEEEVEETLQT